MRKIKRRLAYIYFPIIFAVLGLLVAGFVFAAFVPNYKDYSSLAFGNPPSFTKQMDKKSFVAFEDEQGATFNNVKVTIPQLNQQYAEITCETLGIDAPVIWGDTDDILRAGVGTYICSALPGYNSTVLMSAHNTTYFKNLKDVKKGDIFTVKTTYGIFEYKVSDIRILKENDASAVDFDADEEQLVLYTCYPFAPLASVSGERMFVYCDKYAGPSAMNWEVDL